MKGKFNFKDTLVQRGELMVAGVVALMVAYVVFDAFGYSELKAGREPDDFKTVIRTANEVMESGVFVKQEVRLPDVTHEHFKPENLRQIAITTDEPRRKRGQPIIFSIEDARVCAGIGSFAFKAAAGAKAQRDGEFRELAYCQLHLPPPVDEG